MPFKFTMLINFQGQGFSETWYHTGSGSLSAVPQADLDTLLSARNRLTAASVKLVGWRLSDVANPRLTKTGTCNFSAGGSPPDVPTNAWLATVRGPDGQGRRQWWIRGVPDAAIVWDDKQLAFKPTGTFKSNYDAYVAIVTKSPWAIKVVTPLKTSTKKGKVTGLTINAVGSVRLVGQGGTFAPLTKTAPVIVTGFKSQLAHLNGVYQAETAAEIADTSIDLLNQSAVGTAVEGYRLGAFARTAEYQYITPNNVSLVSPRERKIGRAFFVPAGRRRRA